MLTSVASGCEQAPYQVPTVDLGAAWDSTEPAAGTSSAVDSRAKSSGASTQVTSSSALSTKAESSTGSASTSSGTALASSSSTSSTIADSSSLSTTSSTSSTMTDSGSDKQQSSGSSTASDQDWTTSELETDAQGLPKLDHVVAPPAQQICDTFANQAPLGTVRAVQNIDEVNIQPAIVPSSRGAYKIILPEGQTSYLRYNVVLWDSVQQITMSKDTAYRLIPVYGEDDFLPKAAKTPTIPSKPVEACPDAPLRTKHRYFQHWVPVTIEFSASGPREVWLMGHLSPISRREMLESQGQAGN